LVGKKLVLEIETQKPELSKTGKSHLLASSGGFQETDVEVGYTNAEGEKVKSFVTVNVVAILR
jgi:hypothetical protein